MVGQGGTNEGHHHQGREICDADLQSGFAFPVSAESEPAANERAAVAAFPAGNAAAATLHQAGADTVPAANIPTGQANSSAGPDPSARRDPAKSNSGSTDAKRAASGRFRRIAIVPSRRPRYREFYPGRPSTNRIWWGSFVRESDKRRDYPRHLLELPP